MLAGCQFRPYPVYYANVAGTDFRPQITACLTGYPPVNGDPAIAAPDGPQSAGAPLSAPVAPRWHRPGYDSSRRVAGSGPAVGRTPCRLAGARTPAAPDPAPQTGSLV